MKIYIPKRVESDFSFISNAFVELAVYEAKINPQGAVSVITKDGTSLGIKLDEFLFLSKEDRDAWINIAHPNIPDIKENDEIKSSEKFTNLGELLNFYLKKYNLGNQNKYSAIMEVKKAICAFLQQKIDKLEKQKVPGLMHYILLRTIESKSEALTDLGKGILPTHDHKKKTRLDIRADKGKSNCVGNYAP